MRISRRAILITTVAASSLIHAEFNQASAADNTFLKNTAFFTAANWSTTHTPQPTDTLVIFGSSGTLSTSDNSYTFETLTYSETANRGLVTNSTITTSPSNSLLTFTGTGTSTDPLIAVTVANTFTIRGSNNSTGSGTLGLILNTSGTFSVATGGTLSISANIAQGSTGTTITKSGGGYLSLSNSSNAYDSGVAINGGTLGFDLAGDLGPTPTNLNTGFITLDGGALQFTGTSLALNANRAMTLNAGGGTIDVMSATGSFEALGAISGSGSLNKTGIGTLVLTASSTYTGGTTVNAGTLSVDASSELGSTAGVNSITLNGGVLQFTANISGGVSANRAMYLGGTTSSGVGTVTVTSGKTVQLLANIRNLSSTSGVSGSLVKYDSGTLVLSGNSSTYTGGTRILGGTVLLNNTTGSATGTGEVDAGDGTAANAGTLGGSGIAAGDIVINANSTLAPGSYGGSFSAAYTAGTLTGGGSLTLHSGSTVIEKIASATSYDSTSLTSVGSVNFDSGAGTVKLSLLGLAGAAPSAGDQYNLITVPLGETVNNFSPTTPTSAGTFVFDTAAAAAAGFNISSASINYNPAFGDFYVTGLQSVPEPATGMWIVFSATGLFRRRRISNPRPN